MLPIAHCGDAKATQARIDAVLAEHGYRTAPDFGRDGNPGVWVTGPDEPWCHGVTVSRGQQLVLDNDGRLKVEDNPNYNHHQEP
jgi:hypothetical protein